ncbi:valine--tRNA ligase [Shimia marina]|uniref:Valine--tRNA ligase n=1 Tax=Shimia marina TaxID=321267 RepID=A0A0N7LS34_9RHOB|nr:valine--tRNA ligase [Shimia marina]CUH52508.1 Valine--tRNA ligase [Shimia marina]SFE48539.1 valyl-tRNA synthetase [Shimia marina]
MAMEKTFNAAEAEGRLYDAWEKAGCFTAGANAKPGASTYCIMIPPPNVTGVLHMGHAFNNTLQDILIRWKRMQGFDTLWQPGTDHAGIATQMVVERKLAETGEPSRRELGREKFLEKVWDWKGESGGTIVNQLKRLGASCDWDREAFTMSGAPGAPADVAGGNFHDAVLKVFVEMYNKGLIYRGKRLVNWDPHFETAISDLEVENIEVAGHMWHFKYPLANGATYTYVEKDADGNVTLEEERDYISIATTRPETMLGDGAVAVHPSDERYAPIIGQLCEIPVGPKEHRRLIPIITDEYPDKDFGSGAVKITGAHDFNDYQVAKRGGIPMYRLMDTKGAMRADGDDYAAAAALAMAVAKGEKILTEAEADAINLVPDDIRGMDRFEARKLVVEQITAEGLAVMVPAPATEPGPRADDEEVPDQVRDADILIPFVENKPIMQPFGDRSKVVIEPMLTDQWFVDAEKVVGPALDAVRDGTVKILPESGEKTYYHWLENIEPWCISRQLWWGHQIPVWYGLDLSAEDFKDDETNGALDLVEMGRLLGEGGMLHRGNVMHCAASFDDVAAQFLNDNANIPAPLNNAKVVEVTDKHEAIHILAESLAQYVVDQDPLKLVFPVWRDPDVLDTWFSSGLWPIGTLGWPEQTDELAKYFPTSTLVTGQDILFFWVARMMMMQLAVVDQIPFDTVYLHGLVRDAKGKKMSKSTGNVMDPLEIIDEYGADALRFSSAAMAALGGVLKLDMQRIAGYRNFGTKLWNAARFAEMNGVFEDDVVVSTPLSQYRRDTDVKQTANLWIIGETAKVREEVDAALESFRFNDAASALYAFVWGKVCDWYLEFSKPLFSSDDAAVVAETKATMRWVIDQCLILLHPIMPFITEELWGNLGDRAKMLVHADWPSYQASDFVDEKADREMNWVISVIDSIRSVRAQMGVNAGAKIDVVVSQITEENRAAFAANQALIFKIARVVSLEEVDTFPKGTATVAVDGATFGLPLADIIDIDAEKARLEKGLGKLAKELGGLRGRLNNPKFVASAPDEVVAEARENLAAREEEEAKIKAALAKLAELN